MAGVVFGITIWAVMTFGGLPMVNPIMRESVAMMPVAWLIAHVAFGMGVGSAPGLLRRFAASWRSQGRFCFMKPDMTFVRNG